MSPLAVDDLAAVDDRRRRIGLPALSEQTDQQRRAIAASGVVPPHDLQAYRQEKLAWLTSAGWR